VTNHNMNLSMECDSVNKKLIIKATVPADKWLGIAWGSGMSNVDATVFAGSGGNGSVIDY